LKILVVDDDRLNLLVAQGYLKSIFEKEEIVLCQNPEEVMGILETGEIDIMLLDLMMPKISGYEILRCIREETQYADMPIIMLTALSDKDSFKECFELGANDYITKPIEIIEFKARLNVAIQTRKSTLTLKEMVMLAKRQSKELRDKNDRIKNNLCQTVTPVILKYLHEIKNISSLLDTQVHMNFESEEALKNEVLKLFLFVEEQKFEHATYQMIKKNILKYFNTPKNTEKIHDLHRDQTVITNLSARLSEISNEISQLFDHQEPT
jgi:DNA-binding response OmpR family regulator